MDQSRRAFLSAIGRASAALALSACGAAQTTASKVPRLGLYQATDPPDPSLVPLLDAFSEGLRSFGWSEGKTIHIDRRYTQNRIERLDEIAVEFVRLPVDVIAASAATAIRAAMKATTTIPIVMLLGTDPIENGLVQSLARPGGNVTGMASIGSAITVKRLEILRDAFPAITRVGIVWDGDPIRQPQFKATVEAARGFRIDAVDLTVDGRDDASLRRVLDVATTSAVDALVVLNVPTQIGNRRKEIVDYAASRKIPAAYPNLSGWVEEGGLIGTGENGPATFRRAASFVDRILRGARAADLPIEQTPQIELILNLKTARALGFSIPQPVLDRATKVIQ